MKKYIAILLSGLICVTAILLLTEKRGQDKPATKEAFKEFKMSKRKGDTSRKPTEWFTLSRAYPYKDIPFESYTRAYRRAETIKNENIRLDNGVWTLAGPTNVGGRVTALAINPDIPEIMYAGAALGGVFKTTDGGSHWAPMSDSVPSLSVGHIVLDPQNPNIIYFGAGEANSSGDSYAGTGLYKSTDAGITWSFEGLPNSRHIGRIAIDPIDNQRIYVAAMGSLFSSGPDRGLYRTTDGGTNWERVLFVNDSTGAIDVAISPSDANIIFAATWQRIRSPQDRRVGGYGSAIWKSTDGGTSWARLSGGLPAPSSAIGRIGLAISPSNPNYIYASYCDHPGNLIGFWRSTNGGTNWSSRLSSPDPGSFSGFGWYFGQIRVHPTNPELVYFGDVELWRSTNGGVNWNSIIGSMHVDFHDLYLNPDNPAYMVAANDGGVDISNNGGSNWEKCPDLPLTQFYAITIDSHTPQRLYGGTQDNSTPRTLDGSLDNWDVIFYGDGFYVSVDFTNSNIIYAEAQYGYLGKSTDGGYFFDIITNGIDWNERVNWCAPVVMSPHNHNILFYGAQKLYKTTNAGNMWNPISPDLTGGDGNGNLIYGTITTISQSAINANVIWVGTDDSRVWVTTNGGTGWNEVSADLPDRWCTRVTADIYDTSAAYVTFSGYKEDDLLPHIFKTTNYGVFWSDISGNLIDIPANDILPDPARQGRLFLASDFGVYYTENDGQYWQPLGLNMSLCPVFDIDLHTATRKLVSGTHGRSMYSYDLTQLVSPGCSYVVGDVNSNGSANGLDVTYFVNYLKGGQTPPDSCLCGSHGQLYAAADVNESCSVNGVDVTYLVNYFKGGPSLKFCLDCPPQN